MNPSVPQGCVKLADKIIIPTWFDLQPSNNMSPTEGIEKSHFFQTLSNCGIWEMPHFHTPLAFPSMCSVPDEILMSGVGALAGTSQAGQNLHHLPRKRHPGSRSAD